MKKQKTDSQKDRTEKGTPLDKRTGLLHWNQIQKYKSFHLNPIIWAI